MYGFALQLKPVGSFCNLACSYCYARPFLTEKHEIMSDQVLERAISLCLKTNEEPTITWHGGEPAIPGIKFYKKSQNVINRYRGQGQIVRQVMQTNATCITPNFARFLKQSDFEVGVSLDGPKRIHGINRVDVNGKNSFDQTMRGLYNLREAGFSPSVIATITLETLPFATEVFDFLISMGFTAIKYSPVFDSVTDQFSISNEQWYVYLSTVFDEWMRYGNPDISVVNLDEVIAWLDLDGPYPMCSSNQTCRRWVSIDPDGTMYPCAYFRYAMPYGNILTRDLQDVVKTREYQRFEKIFVEPPIKCQQCSFLKLCGNGCPATRLTGSKIDPCGVYVYCEERRKLFRKIQQAFALE